MTTTTTIVLRWAEAAPCDLTTNGSDSAGIASIAAARVDVVANAVHRDAVDGPAERLRSLCWRLDGAFHSG